ncbi:DUF2642 domain-containing protein [Bacillus sp. B190/17]|uniref:DUF2642 domain-containing protein n=1 Tax=Bacillus lumedeiriae TaxID=3058829 RepID=A0ABW8IC71_9BACI
MSSSYFSNALTSLIGYSIGIFSNDGTLIKGRLIAVKKDFLILQKENNKFFYYHLDQIKSIAKNTKDLNNQTVNDDYLQAEKMHDILLQCERGWVTINCHNDQIVTGFLSKVFDDHIILISGEDKVIMQNSYINNIFPGFYEPIELNPNYDASEHEQSLNNETDDDQPLKLEENSESPQPALNNENQPEAESDVSLPSIQSEMTAAPLPFEDGLKEDDTTEPIVKQNEVEFVEYSSLNETDDDQSLKLEENSESPQPVLNNENQPENGADVPLPSIQSETVAAPLPFEDGLKEDDTTEPIVKQNEVEFVEYSSLNETDDDQPLYDNETLEEERDAYSPVLNDEDQPEAEADVPLPSIQSETVAAPLPFEDGPKEDDTTEPIVKQNEVEFVEYSPLNNFEEKQLTGEKTSESEPIDYISFVQKMQLHLSSRKKSQADFNKQTNQYSLPNHSYPEKKRISRKIKIHKNEIKKTHIEEQPASCQHSFQPPVHHIENEKPRLTHEEQDKMLESQYYALMKHAERNYLRLKRKRINRTKQGKEEHIW